MHKVRKISGKSYSRIHVTNAGKKQCYQSPGKELVKQVDFVEIVSCNLILDRDHPKHHNSFVDHAPFLRWFYPSTRKKKKAKLRSRSHLIHGRKTKEKAGKN